MNAIYKREMHAFLTSAAAYVLIAAFVTTMALVALFVVPSVYFQGASWFHLKEITTTSFFMTYPWVAAAILPAVSMRSWSEEYRASTYRLLLTLPMPVWKVVLGKYLSMLTFLALMLLATIVYPIMIAANGGWEAGPVLGGYVGCFLLGAAFLAIGTLTSSLTSNQLVAYMIAFLSCGLLTALGSFAGMFGTTEIVPTTMRYLAVGDHFGQLSRGILLLETPLYLASIVAFCLFVTVYGIERRRYL